MATQYGIDLGQVYRTTEAVKGSRQQRDIRNKLMRWKTADRELATARTEKLSGLKQDVATGQEGAMQALTLFDATEAKDITDALASADKNKREQMLHQIDMTGRALTSVRDAKDPVAQYGRMKKYLSSQDPEAAKNMPELSNPDDILGFVEFGLGRAMQVEDYIKTKPEGEGGWAPKTADDNQAYRAVVQAMTGLDINKPDAEATYSSKFDQGYRDNVLSIAARASELMREKGLNPNSAADAARKEAGKKGGEKPSSKDRNRLLQQYLPK